MKNIININISKDTPAETLTQLYAALKQQDEKPKIKQPLYALNEDIEKLNARYDELFKQIKNSLNLSAKQIENECETLSRKYEFELEELSKMRKLEYDKRQAELEARALEQTPWRRCWLWRLLFQPITNRAQDIIEERAALEAEILHTAEEKANKDKRDWLKSEDEKKPSKRELKRQARKQLKAIVKSAETSTTTEVMTERQDAAETAQEQPQAVHSPQLSGQMTLDELQPVQNRRPRPPKSCRKQ